MPVPSIVSSHLRRGDLPSVHISAILLSFNTTEPFTDVPSLTIVTFDMSVRMVFTP
jgi:hypothetical protein